MNSEPIDADVEEYRALVEYLDDHEFRAEAVSLQKIRVWVDRGEDPPLEATILMTPWEWAQDIAGVNFTSEASAMAYVRRKLLELTPNRHFLIYNEYSLFAASSALIPPKTQAARDHRVNTGRQP